MDDERENGRFGGWIGESDGVQKNSREEDMSAKLAHCLNMSVDARWAHRRKLAAGEMQEAMS